MLHVCEGPFWLAPALSWKAASPNRINDAMSQRHVRSVLQESFAKAAVQKKKLGTFACRSILFSLRAHRSSSVSFSQVFVLVTRPKYPPYRETGVAIPLSHCASCGIADCRCYTPTSFLKNGLPQSKDRPNKGGVAEKACLWSLSRYRGRHTK